MNKSPMKRLHDNIAQRILGADEAIDAVLVCLLSGGHILIEDVPGDMPLTAAVIAPGQLRIGVDPNEVV